MADKVGKQLKLQQRPFGFLLSSSAALLSMIDGYIFTHF